MPKNQNYRSDNTRPNNKRSDNKHFNNAYNERYKKSYKENLIRPKPRLNNGANDKNNKISLINTTRKTRRMDAVAKLLIPEGITKCLAVAIVKVGSNTHKIYIAANAGLKRKGGDGKFYSESEVRDAIKNRREIVGNFINTIYKIYNEKQNLSRTVQIDQCIKGLIKYSDIDENLKRRYERKLKNALEKIVQSFDCHYYSDKYNSNLYLSDKSNISVDELRSLIKNENEKIFIGQPANKDQGADHAEIMVLEKINKAIIDKEINININEITLGISKLSCNTCHHGIVENNSNLNKKVTVIHTGTHGVVHKNVRFFNNKKPQHSSPSYYSHDKLRTVLNDDIVQENPINEKEYSTLIDKYSQSLNSSVESLSLFIDNQEISKDKKFSSPVIWRRY